MKAEDFEKLGPGSIVESTYTENLYRKEAGGWRVLEPGYATRDLNPERVTPIVSVERNVFEEFEDGDIVAVKVPGYASAFVAVKRRENYWIIAGESDIESDDGMLALAGPGTIEKVGKA